MTKDIKRRPTIRIPADIDDGILIIAKKAKCSKNAVIIKALRKFISELGNESDGPAT